MGIKTNKKRSQLSIRAGSKFHPECEEAIQEIAM